jgi:protein phosphatase
VRLVVGQRSVPGQVRDLNEDSLLILTLSPVFQSQSGPAVSLFAVADGMGGHEGGEIASKLALQVLTEEIVQGIALPSLAGETIPDDGILNRLQRTVVAVNDAVYLARQKRNTDMGTTLTALLVRDQQLFVAHVGDCRAFRWDAGGLQQLTADHSLVAAMVARGQITADEIYTHPQRSVVYRSIGDRPTVEVDTSLWALAPGDRLIVCSDGLWEMLRNEGIQDGVMAEADPQAACDLLVSRANAAGGDDNISVIVAQVVET